MNHTLSRVTSTTPKPCEQSIDRQGSDPLLTTQREQSFFSQGSILEYDTGDGGILTAFATYQLMPGENVHLVIDNKARPLGLKNPPEIRQHVNSGLRRALGCKLRLVACNTAGAVFDSLWTPTGRWTAILQVLRAGIQDIVRLLELLQKPGALVVILATQVTARSGVFEKSVLKLVQERCLPMPIIKVISCPYLAQLIDAGAPGDEPGVSAMLREYVKPYADADIFVLACSHFPALEPEIDRHLAPHTLICNPNLCVVREAYNYMEKRHLFNTTGNLGRVSLDLTKEDSAERQRLHRLWACLGGDPGVLVDHGSAARSK